MNRVLKSLIYICLLAALTLTSLSQTNPWKKLQSPVNSTLRRLTFVDSLTGWAAGESGTIIHTSDGGNNWEVQNSTVQSFITDIFFVNKTFGWATTITDTFPFNTVILKTTNGGEEWIAEDFQDSNAFMRTVFFFDSLNGLIGGTYIAYTSNGGISWTRADVDSNMVSTFPVYEFNFYNHQFGYASGGRLDVAGVVWRTTDSGLNWTAQGISADEVFDVFIFDSLNAIALSGDPEGLYATAKITTTDAGLNWVSEDLLFYGLSFTIDFKNYTEGWSASGYKFLFTSDRGENWSEFETPDSSVIYDLQFTDARTGYAVGENGVILKLKSAYEPAGVEEQNSPLNTFILYQNYPNPFNPSTKIRFVISDGGFVNLKVFDIIGNEIVTLVSEEKSAGYYDVVFNAAGLSSGIYFYKLQVGSFIETKKMILIN